MGQNVLMDKPDSNKRRRGRPKSSEADRGQDRHKPSKMGRVRGPLAEALEELADDNSTDFTEELNRAVREYLVREGRWPRKQQGL